MRYRERVKRRQAKQLATWSDNELASAWERPLLRKDGVVSLRGARLCDAVLAEQMRRRFLQVVQPEVTP
jgi:hypothetical protein